MLVWQGKIWLKIISVALVVAFIACELTWANDFSAISKKEYVSNLNSKSIFENKLRPPMGFADNRPAEDPALNRVAAAFADAGSGRRSRDTAPYGHKAVDTYMPTTGTLLDRFIAASEDALLGKSRLTSLHIARLDERLKLSFVNAAYKFGHREEVVREAKENGTILQHYRGIVNIENRDWWIWIKEETVKGKLDYTYSLFYDHEAMESAWTERNSKDKKIQPVIMLRWYIDNRNVPILAYFDFRPDPRMLKEVDKIALITTLEIIILVDINMKSDISKLIAQDIAFFPHSTSGLFRFLEKAGMEMLNKRSIIEELSRYPWLVTVRYVSEERKRPYFTVTVNMPGGAGQYKVFLKHTYSVEEYVRIKSLDLNGVVFSKAAKRKIIEMIQKGDAWIGGKNMNWSYGASAENLVAELKSCIVKLPYNPWKSIFLPEAKETGPTFYYVGLNTVQEDVPAYKPVLERTGLRRNGNTMESL